MRKSLCSDNSSLITNVFLWKANPVILNHCAAAFWKCINGEASILPLPLVPDLIYFKN